MRLSATLKAVSMLFLLAAGVILLIKAARAGKVKPPVVIMSAVALFFLAVALVMNLVDRFDI